MNGEAAVKSSVAAPVTSAVGYTPTSIESGAGNNVATRSAQLFTTGWDSSQLSKVKATQASTFKDGWINETGAGCKGR